MKTTVANRKVMPETNWLSAEGSQCLFHCHHYNLFHDQTIDDILGSAKGDALRREAAKVAFGTLFFRLASHAGLETSVDRLSAALETFRTWGHGRLMLDVSASGGTATGTHLHYGFSWLEKYGEKVRRTEPADAVAAGAAAGAMAASFNLSLDAVSGSETRCIAKRDPICEFRLEYGGNSGAELQALEVSAVERFQPRSSVVGLFEEEISRRTAKLQEFLSGVAGDERGLIGAFNVWVTLHLADYYCLTAFEAIRALEAKRPDAVGLGEALLREAGHVCVFNTIGNILLSPEYEALFGPLDGSPESIVIDCSAISRALGFGKWMPVEMKGKDRLVVLATATYEAPHWLARYGVSDRSRCYFFQGAVQGFQVLSYRVRWLERPKLTQQFYEDLFHKGSVGFKVSAPRCLTMGDDYCEAVVEAES
jgi:hypothetical protein